MGHKQMRMAPVRNPAGDDFKSIKGIGAAIEQHLHQAGIKTFAQLANQSPERIAALLSDVVGISPASITKQKWIEQATALADKQAPPNDPHTAVDSTDPLFASFNIDLLLDEEHHIRFVRANHHQQKLQKHWTAWNPTGIAEFIAESAGLNVAKPMVATPTVSSVCSETSADAIRLERSTFLSHGFVGQGAILANEAFDLCLVLDFNALRPNYTLPFNCSVAVSAKRLATRGSVGLGNMTGEVDSAYQCTLNFNDLALDSGTYRLEVAAAIIISGQKRPRFIPLAMLDGGVCRVL